MKLKINNILEAEEGKFLTQASLDIPISKRVVGTTIALGFNDSIDNWIEITAKEADDIEDLKAQYANNE